MMTNKEIKKWLYNSDNELNCADCPYANNGEHRGCGQQTCWVTVHCEREKK